MKIIHYNKPVETNELLKLIDPNVKTLLIIPNKYHFSIYKNILKESKIIFNLTLLSANNFLKSVFVDNNLIIDDDISLIEKLKINNRLESDHEYHNNINFINELFKLKQELFYSNIKYTNEYSDYLDYNFIDFEKLALNITYDTIIYCDEEFYPIHHQMLSSINTKEIIEFDSIFVSIKQYFEHSNSIRMLDYVVKNIYDNEYDDLLIIVDDVISQNYLKDKLNELNIPYNNLNQDNNINVSFLKSLFNIINHSANGFDYKNITSLNIDSSNLILLKQMKYHEYLRHLYTILVDTNLFELSFLNKIFTKLFLEESNDFKLLNKLLFNNLSIKLTNQKQNTNNIVIADSSFNSVHFKQVFVLDSTLKNFRPTKASYLLNTKQRNDINLKLISNTDNLEFFKLAQQRLLNCGSNINFHYALLTLDNKSQDLAYFIKLDYFQTTKEKRIILSNNNDNYLHLTTKEKKEDSYLVKNIFNSLDMDKVFHRLNNELKISASSLDEFNKCPYKYLVSRIYKPKLSNDFSYIQLGNIHHHVIEEINKKLIETNTSYNTYSYDKLIKIIDSITYESIFNNDKYDFSKVDQDFAYKQIKANLINFIDSMIYFESFTKYKIDSSESEIRIKYNNPHLDSAYLVGKIDSIMKYENIYYVLDYKSRETKFKELDFNNGINSQLIMYLKLLQESKLKTFGAFYKAINDSFIKEKSNELDLVLNNNDLLNRLSYTKNPYFGIASNNVALTSFDSNLANNQSVILAINSTRSFNNTFVDKLSVYISKLDTHIDTMIEKFITGNFSAQPHSDKECNLCEYKVICKHYFKNSNEEEEESDE